MAACSCCLRLDCTLTYYSNDIQKLANGYAQCHSGVRSFCNSSVRVLTSNQILPLDPLGVLSGACADLPTIISPSGTTQLLKLEGTKEVHATT